VFRLSGATAGKGTITGLRIIAPANATALAGMDVDIPLELASAVSLDSANLRSMRIDLRYDPRLMRPDAVTANVPGLTASFTERSPGATTIQIISDRPIKEASPLVSLKARTYVGPLRTTVLDVDTVTAPGAIITGDDGQLSLETDCQINASAVGLVRPIVFRTHLVDG
ncbi:MAG TPA: hypothetical protein DCZ59_08370, partial [Bacteroidetes bacterium]|nr:hypothetical protein [Bacteroidota bacterium]